MFLPYDSSPRNTPPPVQPLDERDKPHSPVLMLPSAQGSPPNECLALTWHNDNQNKPCSSTSPVTRDIVRPNSQFPDSSVYRQSRAVVFCSPSGQRTVCLQETRCYSLPSETQSMSSRRGSPSPSKYRSFAETTSPRGGGIGSERKGETPSPRGGVGREQKVSMVEQTSPEMRTQSSRVKYTPDKTQSGPPKSTEFVDQGSLDPSVRHRGQRKTRRDGKPGRNLSKSDRYSGILEQDHPEETLSRGILGTWCCFLTCVFVVFLLVITLLVWCSESPSGCFMPLFSTSEKCQKMNISHVKSELQRNLIGQPVAVNLILDTLDASGDLGSNKPHVMFFHGSSGVGKSFTADIIIESIFGNAKTKRESCIHLLSVDLFLRSESVQSKEMYMNVLQDWVNSPEKDTTRCCVSFFIFDELRDDIPEDLIQTLGQTLSQLNAQDDSLQPQHLKVFFIMTLIGSQSISDFLIVNMKRGQDRESLTIPSPNWQEPWKHLVASLDKQDPFWTWLPPADFIRIPFLPLERSHVKQCARQSLSRNNLTVTEERLEWVADQMNYIPDDWPMFSVSGCKKVSSKVGLIHKEENSKPLFEFKKSF